MIDHRLLAKIRKWQMLFPERWPELDPRYVDGEGDNPIAMLIGEAPGAQEAVQGRPFVGASGIMLRRLMQSAALRATSDFFDDGTGHSGTLKVNCWLTNVVKFRPANNRTPTPEQIRESRPWLRQEWIAVGRPRIIVPIGGTALRAVMGLGYRGTITRKAGKPMELTDRDGNAIVVFPQLHPSFGLRGGDQIKRLMERDWERLGEFIEK